MNEFDLRVSRDGQEGLHARDVDVIQVNMGLKCNQSCRHCHLSASPDRAEMMDWPVMEKILEIVAESRPRMVDLTGGAPELNAHLRRFVKAVGDLGSAVQVRTNLTVLTEPGLEDLALFFRDHRVRLVGSMPCYLEDNVKAQRGERVYQRSVEAMRKLNDLGYGIDPDLQLNLVYNPGGAFLPGDQGALQAAYRRELDERFGIRFTSLLTITNMPIGRFQQSLREKDEDIKYMNLLMDAFNPQTVDGLMCRSQISVGWDGTMYDCDFNLAQGMAVNHGAPDHISRFDLTALSRRRIVTGNHCFGCTAGCGSSCGGSLVEDGTCAA